MSIVGLNFKLPIQAHSFNLISIESFQIQIHHTCVTDIPTIDTSPIINRRNPISKMLRYIIIRMRANKNINFLKFPVNGNKRW